MFIPSLFFLLLLSNSNWLTLDPALSNPSLLKQLRSNREVALSSLEEVITKFSVKQDDIEEQERNKRQEKEVCCFRIYIYG